VGYVVQFGDVLAQWPLLMQGLAETAALSLIAIFLGTAIGIAGALCRNSSSLFLRGLVAAYVELVRNTPLLIQLFVIFFVLPSIGIKLSATYAAVLALVLNNGAYTTEIMRSGIESVHPTQIEAGLSLGLSRLRIFGSLVLLPAFETAYPALVSQFILLTLSSSIISAIGADDLMSMANLIQSSNFRSFEIYLVVAAIYIALALVFRLGFWGLSLVLFPRRWRVTKAAWI
jgi:polar amino acid transport system permease protein